MITYLFLCWVMATACTLHVRLLTALEIIQNPKFYDVSGKEFVDLVYDSRVFHDCQDSIVKSTTEPSQDTFKTRYPEQGDGGERWESGLLNTLASQRDVLPWKHRGMHFDRTTLFNRVSACL